MSQRLVKESGLVPSFPGVEVDNEVELGKILRTAGLMAGKDLGCGKVFQVLMIHDQVNWSTGTFKEVSPDTESLKDCKQFFVMGVIIEFQGTEGAGMESHGVDFTRIGLDGKDGTQSIIGFYNDRFIGDPVGQDRCRGESGFQGLEGFLGGIGKVPWDTLAGQPGKWNHDVGIIRNEAAVKISKAKK